jgi:two-component system, NarL family, sensor histidine kinase UhpB
MQDLTELQSLEEQFERIRKEHQQIMHKAVFRAEENERHFISEELHENINQVLAAINLHIAQAKLHVNEEGLNWLQEAQMLLMESITGIRVLSRRLSPVALQSLGLRYALEELLMMTREQHNRSYTLLVDNIDFTTVDLHLQTVLYRIAQHQLINIVTHSSASEIVLKIASEGGRIKMSVYDNGRGVDLKNLQYGKGFSSIQERSEAFGGSFNLVSLEGKKGFTMEVEI